MNVNVTNASYGLYFADTLTLTPEAALTISGRYNAATVDLADQNGGDLSGNHKYDHFNPAAGMTYRVTPWLTAYGGYAVANRAPTPAELSCAGPDNSCSLANFFVGDPDLQQVIAQTWEAGVRGTFAPAAGASLTYGIAYFHTDLDNDIAFINSVTQGRAYFANIGQTRREGFDVSLALTTERWYTYLAYSYIDASYQSGLRRSFRRAIRARTRTETSRCSLAASCPAFLRISSNSAPTTRSRPRGQWAWSASPRAGLISSATKAT